MSGLPAPIGTPIERRP